MTKKTIHLTLLLVAISLSYGYSQNKRGLAYGYHSPEDIAALTPEVSWWYNWTVSPDNGVAEIFSTTGYEYVPMTWNGAFDETRLRNFLDSHPETKYLLGFNEPNFTEQANMTPSQVAAQWPRLEEIADEYNLEIVGPAVNFCGNCVTENGVTYTNPFDYLDDFFAACENCRVDHIAVHSYMNTVSALSWFIGEFEKYNKPIWVTEFAGWEANGNINSINDQINFMVGAVDYLEANPNVYRYAWFIGRGQGISNYPHIDILGDNGSLTELGAIYKQMPTHDPNNVVTIPARIQAEEYNSMHGMLLELTDDVNGFANVGWVDPGDWLEYKIEVPESGIYECSFRIASTKTAALNMVLNTSNLIHTQEIDNSGGWQEWRTYESTIELDAGIHTLRLVPATDGFNINWFQIGNVMTSLDEQSQVNQDIQIYPNPAYNEVTILSNDDELKQATIVNHHGQVIVSEHMNQKISLSLSNIPKGLYLVRLLTQKGVITKKLWIESLW